LALPALAAEAEHHHRMVAVIYTIFIFQIVEMLPTRRIIKIDFQSRPELQARILELKARWRNVEKRSGWAR